MIVDELGAVDLLRVEGKEVRVVDSFAGHSASCTRLRVDSEFRRMAVGSNDNLVSIWDLEDLVCLHTIAFESEIKLLCFSGDVGDGRGKGKYIAVVVGETSIFIVSPFLYMK
jgi:THO complex subunit 3